MIALVDGRFYNATGNHLDKSVEANEVRPIMRAGRYLVFNDGDWRFMPAIMRRLLAEGFELTETTSKQTMSTDNFSDLDASVVRASTEKFFIMDANDVNNTIYLVNFTGFERGKATFYVTIARRTEFIASARMENYAMGAFKAYCMQGDSRETAIIKALQIAEKHIPMVVPLDRIYGPASIGEDLVVVEWKMNPKKAVITGHTVIPMDDIPDLLEVISIPVITK